MLLSPAYQAAQKAGKTKSHYQLVGALASKEGRLRDGTRKTNEAPFFPASDLSRIAREMDVPIVIASFADRVGLRTYATHGLNLEVNWAVLGITCEQICADGAKVIPNIGQHLAFRRVLDIQPVGDKLFLAAVPIRNERGRVVGSLAVLDTPVSVAAKGIAISKMTELGRQLAG